MFNDLDATLAALLADVSAPPELRDAETSFVTPGKDYNPGAPTLNFFLHGLKENRDLRTSVPVIEPLGEHYLVSPPPIRVDCTYLVTAWSSKAGELKAAEEHRLLGTALLWLSGFPTIPDALLQGSLTNPPQMYALSTTVAQTKADESLAHFWSALAIPPRPTFPLTVTVTMQAGAHIDEVPRTERVDIDGVSVLHPALSGRVLDAALAPVAGAAVTVVEENQQATCDQRGRFIFTELPFGTYTLVVSRPGEPDVQKTINYRVAGQVHNVQVSTP
jgi:uncharacterized protein DUF4255/carboxypeptidase family protein